MVIKGAGYTEENTISVNAGDVRNFTKDMIEGWNTISRQNETIDELSTRNYREVISENGNIYEQTSSVLEYRLGEICSIIKGVTEVVDEDVAKKASINEHAATRVGGTQ